MRAEQVEVLGVNTWIIIGLHAHARGGENYYMERLRSSRLAA